jgi:hypothetical protein
MTINSRSLQVSEIKSLSAHESRKPRKLIDVLFVVKGVKLQKDQGELFVVKGVKLQKDQGGAGRVTRVDF